MAITKATASSIAPAAKGDLVAGSATNDAAVLGVGANNTVLTADSSEATGLKWATPAGGGKVLQVVFAETTTATTIASSTLTDTTLTASITPSSASSKVLILFEQHFQFGRSAGGQGAGIALFRGATNIYDIDKGSGQGTYSQPGGASSINETRNFTGVYLDSPATTSSTTYKT